MVLPFNPLDTFPLMYLPFPSAASAVLPRTLLYVSMHPFSPRFLREEDGQDSFSSPTTPVPWMTPFREHHRQTTTTTSFHCPSVPATTYERLNKNHRYILQFLLLPVFLRVLQVDSACSGGSTHLGTSSEEAGATSETSRTC